MSTTRLRALVACAATAAFFAVAAFSQVQGQSPVDTFMKATVACIVAIVLGSSAVRIVESAVAREKALQLAAQLSELEKAPAREAAASAESSK